MPQPNRTSLLWGDRGISMLWTATMIFFLTGAAALAIDTSGAFSAAQTDQNTADLACLAGIRELPNQTAAINTAVAYIDANWPEMTGSTLTLSLPTATYSDGSGNSVYIDAEYGGASDAMLVRVTEITETTFGKTIGQNTITVTQEAACSGQSVRTGIGLLPVGALAGLWSGDLFDCAAKVTGNCGALAPNGSGANAYRAAVANGTTGNFIKHHGNRNSPDPDNGEITIDCYADPCSVLETEPGNMVGPWNQGLTTRFSSIVGATCVEAGWFNCDTINDVFGVGLSNLSTISEPGWWEDSIYGTFADAQIAANPDAEHWYYNGQAMKCDSVRVATVPIVNKDLDWDIGDSASTWPNGRKDMKIIGFYTIYVREPSEIADLGGPMDADIIWFGPDAACDSGEAFQPYGATVALDTGVKLVAP